MAKRNDPNKQHVFSLMVPEARAVSPFVHQSQSVYEQFPSQESYQAEYNALEKIVGTVKDVQGAIREELNKPSDLFTKIKVYFQRLAGTKPPSLESLFIAQQHNTANLVEYGKNVVRRMDQQLAKLHDYASSLIDKEEQEHKQLVELKERKPLLLESYEENLGLSSTDFSAKKTAREQHYQLKDIVRDIDRLNECAEYTRKEQGFVESTVGRLSSFRDNIDQLVQHADRCNTTIKNVREAYFTIPEGQRIATQLRSSVSGMAILVSEMNDYLIQSSENMNGGFLNE